MRDVKKLTPLMKTVLCIRICIANDEIFNQKPTINTNPVRFEILILLVLILDPCCSLKER